MGKVDRKTERLRGCRKSELLVYDLGSFQIHPSFQADLDELAIQFLNSHFHHCPPASGALGCR